MSVYRSINEPWAPGVCPDTDEAASVLIGRENVQKLRMAGIRLSSHFWEETRNAVEAAGGKVIPESKKPYWSEADFAVMFADPRCDRVTEDAQS